MSNRTERYVHYHNSLWEINERAASEPVSFAAESEQAYRSALTRIARRAAHDRADCRVVLLAGPSASGKTTTASLLSKALETFGMSSFVFSLDNFYRSEDETPRQEDGTPDFESVEALDIAAIRECLLSLITERRCEMPVFDFERHRPAEICGRSYVKYVQIGLLYSALRLFGHGIGAHDDHLPAPRAGEQIDGHIVVHSAVYELFAVYLFRGKDRETRRSHDIIDEFPFRDILFHRLERLHIRYVVRHAAEVDRT